MAEAVSPSALRATGSDFDLARAAIADVHQREPVDDQALAAFLENPTCYLFISAAAGEVVGSLNGYSMLSPGKRQPTFVLYEEIGRAHV